MAGDLGELVGVPFWGHINMPPVPARMDGWTDGWTEMPRNAHMTGDPIGRANGQCNPDCGVVVAIRARTPDPGWCGQTKTPNGSSRRGFRCLESG